MAEQDGAAGGEQVGGGATANLLEALQSFAFRFAPSVPETPPPAAKASAASRPKRTGGQRQSGGEQDAAAAAEPEAMTPPPKARKLRQAEETVGASGQIEVEVLCPQCRRDSQSKRQMSLGELLGRPVPPAAAAPPGDVEAVADSPGEGTSPDCVDLTGAQPAIDPTVCRRCRRSLVVQHMSVTQPGTKSKAATGCAFSARLKQYKRQAAETRAEWRLTNSEALALMRDPCMLCGVPADLQAGRPNGITRLRAVPSEVRGMGPYAIGNVGTACSTCNQMKGVHTIDETAEICRTVATHRGLGDFGRFPERFADNVSRKSRSCYLGDTARKPGGTIASKTHSLSNAEFASIVAKPCHYCGKESDPPRHHNGLDRLDNSLRVYTAANAVSCCGTCNMAKGKLAEDFFLRQCLAVASRAVASAAAAPSPGAAPAEPAGAGLAAPAAVAVAPAGAGEAAAPAAPAGTPPADEVAAATPVAPVGVVVTDVAEAAGAAPAEAAGAAPADAGEAGGTGGTG